MSQLYSSAWNGAPAQGKWDSTFLAGFGGVGATKCILSQFNLGQLALGEGVHG
jgi:hypothetical protein